MPPPDSKVQALPGLPRGLSVGRPLALRTLGVSAALALLVACGLVIAVSTAAGPSFFVPYSRGGLPGWPAGPLTGLGRTMTPTGFSVLVLVMGGCYLAILRYVDAVRARWALWAVGLLHLAFLLAPPLWSPDVYGYLAYGRLGALHHLSPYLHAAAAVPTDPVYPFVPWPYYPAPYGPLFLLVSYAVAPLGIGTALWTMKILVTAASAGCVALVWQCAKRLDKDPLKATLFVGLNPVLLVYGVGGAHNDMLMMLLVLTGVYFMLGSRERMGAGATIAAAAIKAPAALLAPFFLLGTDRRRSALTGALAAGLALTAVFFAVFGRDLLGYLDVLSQQGQYKMKQSVPGALLNVVGLDPEATWQGPLMGALLLAIVAVLLWRTWRGADWITASGWAILALLATTTWLWPWYIVWLLPLAALSKSARLRYAALAFSGFLLVMRLPLLLG